MPAENTTLPPTSYRSKQKEINQGPNNTINPEKLEKYLITLKKKGFEQIQINKLNTLPLGKRICYITENKWRSGGFLISVENEYIVYRGFNSAAWTVQLNDIQEVWYKTENKKKEKKIYVLKRPDFTSRFPVSIKNEYNEDVIIYYARDNVIRERYMNTTKFNKLTKNNWTFEDGTQEPEDSEDSE